MTQRYLFKSASADTEAPLRALALMCVLCEKAASPTKALILVPALKGFRDSIIAARLDRVSPRAASSLVKGEVIALNATVTLALSSLQTAMRHHDAVFVLGVFATQQMLNLMDERKNAQALVVVPWLDGDATTWRAAWNPLMPDGGQVPPPSLGIGTALEGALTSLSGLINLSTGLSHPNDKETAICLFRAAVDVGTRYEPSMVQAWALGHGWTPAGAEDLRDVAQAVLDGKRLRVRNYDTTSYWRGLLRK